MDLGLQIIWLFVLAIPIACVAWTITHEEIFREPRDFCIDRSRNCLKWYQRKFFYLFTCEYCFSHYVALLFLILTNYKLLFSDWRGYVIALFSLVWVSNIYMSIYNRLRLDIKRERVEIKDIELSANEKEERK
jgi:type VI protein secretion system component VasK